jgi:hypothetical protein
MSIRVSRRAPLLIAVALLGLAGLAPAARADLLSLSGGNCPGQQLTQPFAAWGDQGSYSLVPGGAFEPGDTDWSTAGGAGVIAGNEPWNVHGGDDASSLLLPAGSSATSPATCIALDSPMLRFFARSSEDSPSSTLRVDVLFKTPLGLLSSLPIGLVPASGDWQPTSPYLLLVNALSLLGGGENVVAFRFTPRGAADWQIDDVYIDPWSKG